MRWLMNLSPSISLRCAAGVCGLVAVLSLSVVRAPAQDVEQRYQQAMDLFNKPDMEGACELFQQVEKQSPGYKQTKTYMSAACRQVPILYEREQKLFNEGVQFFNQGDYEGAKQRFDQAAKVPVKNPKYRSQISGYLNQIQGRENEERLFQEGVKLFDAGNYSQAQSRLNQVAQGGGSKAGEARALLAKINEAQGKQRAEEETNKLFNEGVQLFNARNTAEAYYKFDQVARAGGPKAAEARTYLQRIDQMGRQQRDTEKNAERWFQEGVRLFNEGRYSEAQSRFTQVTQGGGTKAGEARTYLVRVDEALAKQRADEQSRQAPRPPAGEQTLRAGLRAYFEGDVNAAERNLSDYLDKKGPKQALAYFFRGAARSTRYLLSGEQDAEQKKLAAEDFRAFKSQAARLQPPEKFVSPKILALYSEAVGAP